MKLSFKSLFNILKYGGTYTAASITCLFSSICFYYVAYRDKALRDVTLDICISAVALLCCIIQMSIVISSYIRKIIEDMAVKDSRKNNETTNLFNFLYKTCRIFTLAGCAVVLAIGAYTIVYTVLSTVS